jgi:thiamine-monophosphate kinase
MGLQILEREKEVFKVNPQSQPNLDEYTYCIQKQLKPEARYDIFQFFKKNKIRPTSMIDISDGLSSEILHLSEQSKVGIHIYENKIPIDNETIKICKEFKLNEITAALNGGEDYEILFTIDQSDYDLVEKSEIVTTIGHVTKIENGNKLITGLEQAIDLTAQGWSKI